MTFVDLFGPLLTFNLPLQVYSQVGGVLRVELWDTMSEDVLINEVLVQKGYALQCDEPYMSTVRVLLVWWFIRVPSMLSFSFPLRLHAARR